MVDRYTRREPWKGSMDDLIAQIQEKTGLPADKVLEVVTMVTDFFKQNLPDDLIEQITSNISRATSGASSAAGLAGGKAAAGASDAVATVAGIAGSAVSKAMDVVSDLLPDSDTDPTE